jgi:hypothetical protein
MVQVALMAVHGLHEGGVPGEQQQRDRSEAGRGSWLLCFILGGRGGLDGGIARMIMAAIGVSGDHSSNSNGLRWLAVCVCVGGGGIRGWGGGVLGGCWLEIWQWEFGGGGCFWTYGSAWTT